MVKVRSKRLQSRELYKEKNVNQEQQKQRLSDQQRGEGVVGAQKQGKANKPIGQDNTPGQQQQIKRKSREEIQKVKSNSELSGI